MITTIPNLPAAQQTQIENTVALKRDINTPINLIIYNNAAGKTVYYTGLGVDCTSTQCPISINGSSYWRTLMGTISYGDSETFEITPTPDYYRLISTLYSFLTYVGLSTLSLQDAQLYIPYQIGLYLEKDTVNSNRYMYWSSSAGSSIYPNCIYMTNAQTQINVYVSC